MKLLAQLINPVLPPGLGGGTNPDYTKGGAGVGGLIGGIIGAMFFIGFFMALFYLVTGALMWITSEGEKTNLENARRKITHAIIGLIVVGASWAIMTLIGNFLGLDFTNLPIPIVGQMQTGGSGGGIN